MHYSARYSDLCLADTGINFHKIPDQNTLSNLPYGSDHEGLIMEISIKNTNLDFEYAPEIIKYNYGKANWKKYKNLLSNTELEISSERNLTNSDIDHYIQELNSYILSAIDNSIPKIKS